MKLFNRGDQVKVRGVAWTVWCANPDGTYSLIRPLPEGKFHFWATATVQEVESA